MKRVLWGASILIMLMNTSHAQVPEEEDGPLYIFERTCLGEPYLPDENISFAEVVRTSEDEKPRVVQRRYPSNVYVLEKGYGEVNLLTSIVRPPTGETLPKYIWFVISVPRVIPPLLTEADGLLFDASTIKPLLKKNDYRFLWKVSSVGRDRRDIVNNLARGEMNRARVNDIWEKLMSFHTMDSLVYSSRIDRRENGLHEQSYDHIFYFVPVEQEEDSDVLDLVGAQGVTRPGTVYGFVLDPIGNCIAATSLNVIIIEDE